MPRLAPDLPTHPRNQAEARLVRLQLTSADLARIRMVATYGPLAETLFSVANLVRPCGRDVRYTGWRRSVKAAPPLRTIARLIMPPAPFDLVTLTGAASSIDEGAHAFLAAKASAVKAEMDYASCVYAPTSRREIVWPPWVQDLPSSGETRRHLASVVGACHEVTVAPHWQRMLGHLEADVAARARTMATSGVDRFLDTLHPDVRWRPPLLELTTTPGRAKPRDLGGRGLVVVPSVFIPVPDAFYSLADPAAPHVLFIPALQDLRDAQRIWHPDVAAVPSRALASLLGTTRAAVLDAISIGCSTGEIARRVGISPASASEHASVLRGARLVTTRRTGNAVLHTITPLGADLLDGRGRADR